MAEHQIKPLYGSKENNKDDERQEDNKEDGGIVPGAEEREKGERRARRPCGEALGKNMIGEKRQGKHEKAESALRAEKSI